MNTNTIQHLLQGPRFPEKEFIHSGATFGEVYAMAAALHTTLSAPENSKKSVCLATSNKAVMAAALLASLAGAPSLLLPYALSDKALARIHKNTGFTIAITDIPERLPGTVKALYPQARGTEQLAVSPHALPKNELLKIFTGGSTGTPQVWSKTGANILDEAFFLARQFEVNERDCIVTTIPPYHIYGLLFSVVLPLVSSASVIQQTPSFPSEIVNIIQSDQCTLLASVPPHYRVLRDRKIPNSSLRLAFSSAGMLDADDNHSFSTHNKVAVIEVYGSTETGGIATRNRSLGEDNFTPLPTIDWKIIDHRLAVRSPYISPDLPLDSQFFFTTGDRVEAGGNNEFILKGRVDGVTKVGGKRVDLEEIRTLIKNESGVEDCMVAALPEPGGREHRIAALVQGQTADINMEQMRKILKRNLEPYALPRRIKIVALIPMQANGKYDRTAILHLLET